LAASLERLLASVPDDALVLDIGGWGKPLSRADWVLDVMPYQTRGFYGHDGDGNERFSEQTWVQRDICAKEPYPFRDKQFDFVVCSHTLEDVRDPIWVCEEINRIGKGGYVEVPSRLEEQSYGIQGPWVGWGHHHWLVDISDETVRFTFKHHILNRVSDHFPREFWMQLTDEQRVQSLWWDGTFDFEERLFIGPGEIDVFLSSFVSRNLVGFKSPSRARNVRRTLGRVRRALSATDDGAVRQ
jgi:hypothetical protein